MPAKFVRVRLPNGDHATVPTAAAKANDYTILADHEAIDKSGRPLPAKHNTSKTKKKPATATEAVKTDEKES